MCNQHGIRLPPPPRSDCRRTSAAAPLPHHPVEDRTRGRKVDRSTSRTLRSYRRRFSGSPRRQQAEREEVRFEDAEGLNTCTSIKVRSNPPPPPKLHWPPHPNELDPWLMLTGAGTAPQSGVGDLAPLRRYGRRPSVSLPGCRALRCGGSRRTH